MLRISSHCQLSCTMFADGKRPGAINPQAFYELLLLASGRKKPDAMKPFAAAHPEFTAFATSGRRMRLMALVHYVDQVRA